MKPGYKTTEFWLTAAAVVGGLLLSSGALAPEHCSPDSWCGPALAIVGLIVSALGALGYTYNRSKLKAFDGLSDADADVVTGDPS